MSPVHATTDPTAGDPADGSAVEVEIVAAEATAWFDEQLTQSHPLKAGRAVGDYLRQVVKVRGRPAALLA